jgi:hypothetical protein
MKIFGYNNEKTYTNFIKESGYLFGHNDVFQGKETTSRIMHTSFFGTKEYIQKYKPTLYLRVPTNYWSTFTGKLR